MERDSHKIIGNNIKRLRAQHHFTQEELAELINVSSNHIYRIEAGTSHISLKVLFELMKVFSVGSDAIIEDIENSKDKSYILRRISEVLDQSSEKEIKIILQTIYDLHRALKEAEV